MAWSTPATVSTGDLIEATEWNEVVNDLRYLKGIDGTVTLQDGLITQELTPDANDTHDLGSNGTRYRNAYLSQEMRLGDTGVFTGDVASGTSSQMHITRNAYYDGSWKRRVADADASALVLDASGDLVFYGSSDANTTADSAITFAERFRITKAGVVTGLTPASVAAVGVKVTASSGGGDQTVTGGGGTLDVAWDTEEYDTSSFHTGTSDNLTIPTTGLYSLLGGIEIDPTGVVSAGQSVWVQVRKNGTEVWSAAHQWHVDGSGTAANTVIIPIATTLSLAASDVIDVRVTNNLTGDAKVIGDATWTHLSINLISKAP